MASDGDHSLTPMDASDRGSAAHGSSTALRPPPSAPDRPGRSTEDARRGPDGHRSGVEEGRANLAGIDRSVGSGGTTPPSRPRWRLVTAYVVVAVLLMVAVVVGVQANRQLGRTDDSLQAVRGQLRTTTAQVAVARAQLAAADARTEAAQRTLDAESAQLASDQAQLAKAQAGVHAKGVSIGELDTCLSGVEKALNQIAVGDQSGAASTLDGVSANCQNAEPSG